MAVRKTRSAYIALLGKQSFYRASLLTMVALGMALMMMSKTNSPAVIRLRTSITDIMTPVLSVASRPMDTLYDAGSWVRETALMREENIRLKSQNFQLMQWQQAAKDMESENHALRMLLNVVPAQKSSYITARVVSDLGGPYIHSALISGGIRNGIKKDEAVINENGLVGRVVDVGEGSARVLLLGDINSRVPVIAEHAHEKSILIGNNSDLPTLSYLSVDSKIKVGERIVTSGDGGIFPEGVPVGIVIAVDKGIVKVQPFVDATRVEYVSVIDQPL